MGGLLWSERCLPNARSIPQLPLSTVERYFITVLDEHSTAGKADEAGPHLFAWKQRSRDAVPPTSAFLVLHVKRHGNSVALPTGAGPETMESGEFSGRAFHPVRFLVLQKVCFNM